MTFPVHLVVQPLSSIFLIVRLSVYPVPLDFIVDEVSLVNCSVRVLQLSFTMLLALVILPFIPRAIWPFVAADSCLFTINPVSCIFDAVGMDVHALAMLSILEPFSIV